MRYDFANLAALPYSHFIRNEQITIETSLEAVATKPEKQIARDAERSAFRYALAVSLALIVFASAAVLGLYLIARQSLFEATRNEVQELAQIAATLVDGNAHRQIRNPSQTGSELHLRALAPLVKFHRATNDAIYVYTAIMLNSEVYFVLGTDYLYRVPGDTLPPDPIMMRYIGTDQVVRQALKTQAAASNGTLQREVVRSYLSGYAPFRSDAGFEGVVGVDIDAAKLEQRISRLNWGLFVVLAVIILSSMVLASITRVWRLRLLQNTALGKDLERARDDNERTANITSLAAAVVHEFSQHLMVANGHLDLAEMRPTQQHLAIDEARKAIRLANDAVEQMRALTGSSWATLRSHRLSDLIDNALQRLARRGLDVSTIRILPSPPHLVRADQLRLESVLGQLLRNALEANGSALDRSVGEATRVTVQIVETRELASLGSWSTIYPSAAMEHSVAVVIRDCGPHLSASVIESLGRPFFTTKGAGRGMGFAVVKSVLRECGGSLQFAEHEGGNQFALILPVQKQH